MTVTERFLTEGLGAVVFIAGAYSRNIAFCRENFCEMTDEKTVIKSQLLRANYETGPLLDIYLASIAAGTSKSSQSGIRNSNSGGSLANITSGSTEEHLDALLSSLILHLLKLSQEVDVELTSLQETAAEVDNTLLEELDTHALKLSDIESSVKKINENFLRASNGAMKIGERLSVADNEKQRICTAIKLVEYIEFFEEKSSIKTTADIEKLLSMSAAQIRECLPPGLKAMDWGVISQVCVHLSWNLIIHRRPRVYMSFEESYMT